MSATQSAEERQAAIDARCALLAQKQRDQGQRFADDGRCEECGASDAPTVVDFSNGGDGIRRLCAPCTKAAGLDVVAPRSAVGD